MKTQSALRDKLLEQSAAALIGILAAAAALVAAEFLPILEQLKNLLTKDFLLKAVELLGLALTLCLLWVWYLKSQLAEFKKPLADQFDFDTVGGFYRDPKSGREICASCLADGKITHLMAIAPDGPRRCNACHSVYRAPLKK